MSNLLGELLLRLAKVLFATLLGAGLYLVATGPLAEPGSLTLGLLCWLAGAALVLLVESSPI